MNDLQRREALGRLAGFRDRLARIAADPGSVSEAELARHSGEMRELVVFARASGLTPEDDTLPDRVTSLLAQLEHHLEPDDEIGPQPG